VVNPVWPEPALDEHWARAALVTVAEPMVVLDLDGIVVWANPAAGDEYGLRPGRRWSAIVVRDDRDRRTVYDACGEPVAEDRELLLRHLDGGVRSVVVRRGTVSGRSVLLLRDTATVGGPRRSRQHDRLAREILAGFVATDGDSLHTTVDSALSRLGHHLDALAVEVERTDGPSVLRWSWSVPGAIGGAAADALTRAVDDTARQRLRLGDIHLTTDRGQRGPAAGILVVPLSIGPTPTGHLAVAGHLGDWPEDDIELVRVVGHAVEALVARCEGQAEAQRARRRYEALVRDVSDVVAVVSPAGSLEVVSPAFSRLLGHEEPPDAVWPLVHPGDHERLRNLLEAASARPSASRPEATVRIRRHDHRWLTVAVTAHDATADPAVGGLVLTARDITEAEHQRALLHRVASLEAVLQRATRRLVDVSSEEFDAAVEESLGQVAREMGADRAYVNILSQAGLLTCAHEWTADDIAPVRHLVVDQPQDALPLWARAARDAGVIAIDDIDDIGSPATAHERAVLRRLGTRSVIDVWFRWQGEVRGSVGFCTVHDTRLWDDTDANVLRRLADAIAATEHRCRWERSRRRVAGLNTAVQQVASRLLDSSDDDFDHVVTEALGTVAEVLGADRGYLNVFTGPDVVTCTHEWTRPGIPAAADRVVEFDLSGYPLWSRSVRTGGVLVVDDAHDLGPDHSSERELLASFGTRSVIDAAYAWNGEVVGFVGFATLGRSTHWGAEAAPALQRLGDAFAAADRRRRLERRWRALAEHAYDMVTVIDAEGRFRYVSPSNVRWMGWSAEDLIGLEAATFVRDDEQEAFRDLLRCLPADGTPTTTRFRTRHRDGTWRVLETVGVNRVDDPEIGGFVFNARDVTDRVAAEEALARSELWHRSLILNTHELISVRDADGNMLWASPTVAQSIGGHHVSVQRWRHFVHPDDLPALDRAFAEAKSRPGGVARCSYRVLHPSGRWRPLAVIFTNLLDDPAVGGVVANGWDLTTAVDETDTGR
jgi:PAS domain S-box-containing protein